MVNTAKALYLALLYQATEQPIFVLVDGNKEAETLLESTEAFFQILFEGRDLPPPQLIPALDVLPHQRLSPHNEIAEKRAVGLWRLSTQKIPLTIVPLASALLRTESSEFYRQLAITLRKGEELPLEDLIQHLESIGYERRDPVEMVGEYSVQRRHFRRLPSGGIQACTRRVFRRPDRVDPAVRCGIAALGSESFFRRAAAASRVSEIADRYFGSLPRRLSKPTLTCRIQAKYFRAGNFWFHSCGRVRRIFSL